MGGVALQPGGKVVIPVGQTHQGDPARGLVGADENPDRVVAEPRAWGDEHMTAIPAHVVVSTVASTLFGQMLTAMDRLRAVDFDQLGILSECGSRRLKSLSRS